MFIDYTIQEGSGASGTYNGGGSVSFGPLSIEYVQGTDGSKKLTFGFGPTIGSKSNEKIEIKPSTTLKL